MHRLFQATTVALCVTAVACSAGKKVESQTGYRGTGMEDLYSKTELANQVAAVAAKIPKSLPAAGAPRPLPMPWKNVQVLTDVSADEMTRTMLAMSQWVAGTQSNCQYCHNLSAPWDDTSATGKPLYTKVVARRMLQMVRNINQQYSGHVLNTGVTCYTCHLGKPIPNGVWFAEGSHQLERYFLDVNGVRVQTHVQAPSNGNRSSVKQAEWTYALMIKMSSSLGVSCNHCHNSRVFTSWEEAPPQRVQAMIGAEMVRDLNQHYLTPLEQVFPVVRRGPAGDAPKLQCMTCHNGAYRPLYGYPMAKDYPALWGRPDWNGVKFPAVPAGPLTTATPATAAPGKAPAKAATGDVGPAAPTSR